MRIVFFGSDDFAAAHLKDLFQGPGEVVGCVTQPDRPKGRGMKMNVSPIKVVGLDHGVVVLQPNSLKEDVFLKELSDLNADLFVVIAYGRFLPQILLDMPPKGAINLHPSLLPSYRGAAPINWAIIDGQEQTGISIIQLNTRMDAGDVIGQIKVSLSSDESAITLKERLIPLGSELLRDTIVRISEGECQPIVQDSQSVTLAPKLSKEDGRIDWAKQSAVEIDNRVRGLLPWPAAFTSYQGKMIKILEAKPIQGQSSKSPGEVVDMNTETMTVATRDGMLEVFRVQPESSKAMSCSEFIRGYRIERGHILGD